MASNSKDPCAGRESDPAQDPCVAKLLRKAAVQGAIGGSAVTILAVTMAALFHSWLAGQFWHGASWGFGIGLGILLGGTVLNIVVGLIDQVKSDILGN
jgi:hypothetical protein